jgi:hypothetical protein
VVSTQAVRGTMGDAIKASSEKMSRLQKMVHAGSTKPGPATVLLKRSLQESEQGLATGTLVGETAEPKLLARAGGTGSGA